MPGFTVLLQGQDISATVREETLKVEDTLAQGAGTGGGGSTGRSATCSFTTSLGPVAQAYGAGQTLPTGHPVLVRDGLVQVYDASGVNIFTGHADRMNDKTDMINPWTAVQCTDLWQDLSRIVVNEVYVEQTDAAIITDLCTTYAPSLDTSLVAAPSLVLPSITFQEMSLQQAIQQIADITGYQVSVTPDGKLLYQSLAAAQSAPFSLSDTGVNGSTVAGMWVDAYQQDDQSAINRVIVRGGTIHSQDFTQDMSNQVTASNLTFIFAYRPHHAADGKIHLTSNGTELNVGYANTTDALISDGGTFDALVNQDQKVAQLNAVPSIPFLATYQYTAPLVLTVTDPASHAFFGRWLEGVVNDSAITDIPTGLVRGRAVLAQQSFGLTHLTCHTRKYGLSAGMKLRVDHYKRGIHGTYQIQKVTYESQGNNIFYYNLELGAWQWNVVDVLMQVSRAIYAENVDLNPAEETVSAETLSVNVTASVTITTDQRTPGGYYARTAPVGDGHDLYAGLGTITS